MRILVPLVSASTSAVTAADPSADASDVTVSPSTSSSGVRLMLEPTASSRRSISRISPTATLCWRPPLRTIAYTPDLLSLGIWLGGVQHRCEGTRQRTPQRAHRGSRVRGGSQQGQTVCVLRTKIVLLRMGGDRAQHYRHSQRVVRWSDPGSWQARRGHARWLRPRRLGGAVWRRGHGAADG